MTSAKHSAIILKYSLFCILSLSSIKLRPDCDVNCHKKCQKLTANLCGVNQKLIVEALSSVRRGTVICPNDVIYVWKARVWPCDTLELTCFYVFLKEHESSQAVMRQSLIKSRHQNRLSTMPIMIIWVQQLFHIPCNFVALKWPQMCSTVTNMREGFFRVICSRCLNTSKWQ